MCSVYAEPNWGLRVFLYFVLEKKNYYTEPFLSRCTQGFGFLKLKNPLRLLKVDIVSRCRCLTSFVAKKINPGS
jgi:hypothetical protein